MVVAAVCEAAPAKQAVATGRGGAVATISHAATRAAFEILERGGNAVDAAVAAGAVLGVTEPFSCGIGGGGFMLIYLAESREVVALDFRENAPRAFSPDAFLRDGAPLPFDEAVASGLSVGVPGTVRGWHEALARYGTMELAEVLQPAIAVAEEGFVIEPNFARLAQRNVAKLATFESTAALYLRDGRPLRVGTHFRNPDLARSYRALAAGGVEEFYQGEIARAIVAAVNRPPVAGDRTVPQGRLTAGDLRDYEVRFREPIRSTYRGYEIYGMPTPSSGGIAIAEALNILECFPLADLPRAQVEHLYLEASRLVFADRAAYVGDRAFVDVPVAGLLAKAYARQRAATIDRNRTHGTVAAGDPFPFQDDPSRPLRPVDHDTPAGVESAHTTHYAVADAAGNIVACTFTIESWGGSGIVVPGWGFILNNELTDFDFTGPGPNVPEARKRPRSSMSPTIVLRGGRPAFTIGSPGGATIITTVLQTIVNHIDLGRSLAEALAMPRMSQRNGARTDVETLFNFAASDQAGALAALGHEWHEVDEIGAANGIAFHPDGTVTAVSEPVRHGGGSVLVQDIPDPGVP